MSLQAKFRAQGLIGGREVRSGGAAPRFRSTESRSKKGEVVGYGAVFNEETTIAGQFREQIAPGAFDQTLREDDPVSAFNHDLNFILGRQSAGTLKLTTDDRGLKYRIKLSKSPLARHVREALGRGDVRASSFAFRVKAERWDESGKLPLRTVTAVQLFEVGPVVFPAYPSASSELNREAQIFQARHWLNYCKVRNAPEAIKMAARHRLRELEMSA